MAEIYIQTQPTSAGQSPELYQLTCTTDVTFRMSGQPTQNPVEDKSVVTDHYIKSNKEWDISGMISNIRNIGLSSDVPQRTVKENIEALEALRDSGQPFTLFFDKNLTSKPNCVFTNLQFSKSSGVLNSYNVSMTIQQLTISPQASFVAVKANQDRDVNNQSSGKFIGNDNNTRKENSRSIFYSTWTAVYNLATGRSE